MNMNPLLAPAETPAAAPPPASTPAPVAAPPPPVAGGDDPFAKVDERFFPTAKPSEAKPVPSVPAKPSEPARPGESGPKLLREELSRVKGELETKNKSLSDLESKIKDYEARGKDTTALAQRAGDLEKQIAERDAQIRAYRQEASPEFKAKYDEPFNQRAADAKIEIEALQIGQWTTDDRTEEKQWKPIRQATWEKDFAALFNLPYAEAKNRAKDLFGEEAGLVMDHYNALHRLTRERGRALELEREQAVQKNEEDQTKLAQTREGFVSACTAVHKDLENKFPDFYTAPPDDKDAEEALKEGWRLLDLKPQTFQQAVVLLTRNRLNAAAAPMLQLVNRRLKAEISILKEKLDKRSNSGPGKTKTPASGGGAEPNADEFDVEKWKQDAREALSSTS